LEVIIKSMFLQLIYNLSDPRLEEEIADRISFQIFLGLTSGDSIPDETTICRYRKLFAENELDKKLFESFYNQLKRQNIVVEKGTIVDATIKEAQATHQSNRAKDADFTTKRGKPYYGYKGHIAIDEDSEIIKKVEFTTASVHDSKMFDQLIDYSENAVFADKGYANKQRRKNLERKGIFDGILLKGYRNKLLTTCEKMNRMLSTIRNKVERPFAYMKRILGYSRCSY
jgi:IS5 family transposase